MPTQTAVSVGARALLDDSFSLPPSRPTTTPLIARGRSATRANKPVLALPVAFRTGLHRVFVVAALLSTALACDRLSLTAQEIASRQGWIQILEPREWATEDARGIRYRAKRSLRIIGLAQHPSGISEVRLNGVKASLVRDPNGEYRFTGYVRVEEGLEVVDVVALVMGGGGRILRSLPLETLPADQTFTTPEDAWSEGEGGFRGRRWAVVVGISEFQDPQIPDLRYADADARAFHAFLLSERAGLGGFRSENTLLLLNEEATYRAMRTAILTFLSRATEDDIVVIYVSGHGAPDRERVDDHYLLPYDAEVDDLRATAFNMQEFAEAVGEVDARHIILFADACHSAQVGGQLAARELSVNRINQNFLEGLENTLGGVVAFTASQVNQVSREDIRWGGGHGVFTHYLLNGLAGSADRDSDKVVTLGELTEFVRDQVRRDTGNSQIPSVSQTAFDFYLPLSVVLPHLAEADPAQVPPVQREDSLPIVQRPEEQPTPEAEAEAGIETAEAQFSAGAAAFKSLLIPGLGQMTTERTGRGLAFLGGAATAVSLGFMWQTKEIQCGARVTGECPSDYVVGESTERPYMTTGLMVAAAFAVASAIDAYRGARGANITPRNATPQQRMSRVILESPRVRGSVHRLELDLVRLRF
ncbi:caspase domain-containing protein [Gemmatimonadota bacterium]